MSEIRKNLGVLSEGATGSATQKAAWRKANREWLRKSQGVALRVLNHLREHKMSQRELAELMQVQPQQINKLLKGTENLTLETISKLEAATGIVLVTIAKAAQRIELKQPIWSNYCAVPPRNVVNKYIDLNSEVTYTTEYEDNFALLQ